MPYLLSMSSHSPLLIFTHWSLPHPGHQYDLSSRLERSGRVQHLEVAFVAIDHVAPNEEAPGLCLNLEVELFETRSASPARCVQIDQHRVLAMAAALAGPVSSIQVVVELSTDTVPGCLPIFTPFLKMRHQRLQTPVN